MATPSRRRARRRAVAGVVVFPGAGASSDHPALLAIDEALSPRGIEVARADFPYRLAGRRAPDRPPVLIASVRDAAGSVAGRLGVGTGQLCLGGRSMGGRMCSVAVAEGLGAAGLVLVSYPLHPPGKPDKLRAVHFGALEVPCLFISGTRDAFATPDELERETASIPGPVTHRWIDGGDHGLRRKDAEVARAVLDWVTALG